MLENQAVNLKLLGLIIGNFKRFRVVPGTGDVSAFSTLFTAFTLHKSESRSKLKMELFPTFVVPTR